MGVNGVGMGVDGVGMGVDGGVTGGLLPMCIPSPPPIFISRPWKNRCCPSVALMNISGKLIDRILSILC
jgi:hypothetical protein